MSRVGLRLSSVAIAGALLSWSIITQGASVALASDPVPCNATSQASVAGAAGATIDRATNALIDEGADVGAHEPSPDKLSLAILLAVMLAAGFIPPRKNRPRRKSWRWLTLSNHT